MLSVCYHCFMPSNSMKLFWLEINSRNNFFERGWSKDLIEIINNNEYASSEEAASFKDLLQQLIIWYCVSYYPFLNPIEMFVTLLSETYCHQEMCCFPSRPTGHIILSLLQLITLTCLIPLNDTQLIGQSDQTFPTMIIQQLERERAECL